MPSVKTKRKPEVLGWREFVGLPDLGIERMRAKIDTGARTSALHAVGQERIWRGGVEWVGFLLSGSGRSCAKRVEARIHDERNIKNTSGIPERRLIIRTTLLIGRHRWHVDVSLADRERMGFDLILGRTAIRGRGVLVDPGHSFLLGPPKANRTATSIKASETFDPAVQGDLP